MKIARLSGYILIAIGILHNSLGVMLGWQTLLDMHQSGWFDSTGSDGQILFDREAISWFLITGFFWILFGIHMQQAIKKGLLPSASIGWGFIAMGITVAFIMPVSGAYLFIALGFVMVISNTKSPIKSFNTHVS